ncbi:hypothetical protein HYZ41_02295 [archaeon]|nr:hypothetical protein [archaeon]
MKKYLILLILVLVAISGCTSRETKYDPQEGLVINSFDVSPLSVRDGELVIFGLDIENIGGTTATNARVDLYGVENQWRDSTGSPLADTQPKELGTLRPPDPQRNVPGQFKITQWQLMTPLIPEGITHNVPVEARVSYDYKTNGYIDIPAISEAEFNRKRMNNEQVDMPAVIASKGPIAMAMDQKFSPIRVDTSDRTNNEQQWPLRIIFKNVGKGFPITPETDDKFIGSAGGKLTGTIKLSGAGNPQFSDCLGFTSGTEIDLDSADILPRLRDPTGDFPVACTISIDKTVWGDDRPEDRIKLTFELAYRYYVKSEAVVTVSGR